MRTFDLAPLYRSTVGFDRLFSMLDGFDASTPGYPPYNIERTGENDYRISIAVAGFAENELTIESKENTLTVKGEKKQKEKRRSGEVLYQGIAARAFERAFQLADYVVVKGANLENGLAARRPRARDPRGEEAAPDRHQRQSQAAAWSRPRSLPDAATAQSRAERPGSVRGAFYFEGLVRQRAGVDLASPAQLEWERERGRRRRCRLGWSSPHRWTSPVGVVGLSGRLGLRQRRSRRGALHGAGLGGGRSTGGATARGGKRSGGGGNRPCSPRSSRITIIGGGSADGGGPYSCSSGTARAVRGGAPSGPAPSAEPSAVVLVQDRGRDVTGRSVHAFIRAETLAGRSGGHDR